MIGRSHDLPLMRQAEVLHLSRGNFYYLPRPVSAVDLAIMGRTDKLHLEFPFAGSRMLRDFLHDDGVKAGRDRVITLMRRMGVEALYRRPGPRNRLRGMKIDRPNQVWAMDITDTTRRDVTSWFLRFDISDLLVVGDRQTSDRSFRQCPISGE